MSRFALYEATLQRLADKDRIGGAIEEAVAVLELASKQPEVKTPNTQIIVTNVRMAITSCNEAMRINGEDWSSGTDDEIREAIDHLSLALAYLPAL